MRLKDRAFRSLTSFILVAIVALYTEQEVRNAECGVACRREGYTTGVCDMKVSQCWCQDNFDYSAMTHQKKRTLPHRRWHGEGNVTVEKTGDRQRFDSSE